MTSAVNVVTLLVEEAMTYNKEHHLFEPLHNLVAVMLRLVLPGVSITHTETCGDWHTGRTRFGRWIPGKLFIVVEKASHEINVQELQEKLSTLFEVSFSVEVAKQW